MEFLYVQVFKFFYLVALHMSFVLWGYTITYWTVLLQKKVIYPDEETSFLSLNTGILNLASLLNLPSAYAITCSPDGVLSTSLHYWSSS